MGRNTRSNSKWPTPNIRVEKLHIKDAEAHSPVHREIKQPEPSGVRQRGHRK